MSKEVNEVHWMSIESVARELSAGNRIVSTSDVFQWCGKKNLKISCHLFNKLARPQYEYCPLLEDGYYQLVARKILQHEDAKLGAQNKITDPLSATRVPTKNYDINSLEFLNQLNKKVDENHKKILNKAKGIFERWKSKGGLRVKHGYGDMALLDGVYTLHVDKELSDWMKKAALGYEVFDLNSLYVIGDEDEIFQIVDSNGQSVTIKLKKEDLIVTKDALLVFEKEYLLKTRLPKQEARKVVAQDPHIPKGPRRLDDLKKFINELTVYAKNNRVEFDPFDMVCSKKMLLAELEKWERARVSSKDARLWRITEFPKKVWESKMRRDFCSCVSAGGNVDKEYFKKFNL